MTFGFRTRRRRHLALAGDFPDTGETISELIAAAAPADYDAATITFGGVSGAGLERPFEPYPAPVPPRPQPPAPPQPDPDDVYVRATESAKPRPPARPGAQPDPRDTGPLQRLPRMTRMRERPRPQRAPDLGIFVWSNLIHQHIMLCFVCPEERRSRYADPIAMAMPLPFESLRQSAYIMGWRLDAVGRWACPACRDSSRYHPPAPVTVYHPGTLQARGRTITSDDGTPLDAETMLRGAAAHDLRLSVEDPDLLADLQAAEARYDGRHRTGAR